MAATQPPLAGRRLVKNVLNRGDYAIIGELVEAGSKVLDLGCGEGELMEWLADNKNVRCSGVEISRERVQRAIARGVSVYQGDIDQGLADYPDKTFDYVILSQTLQQTLKPLKVLREMLRVGKRIIVAFPNFGHWSVRWSHLVSGRAPRTGLFPYRWYDSPNIHFLTVDDFEDLCSDRKWLIERSFFLAGNRHVRLFPNLTAEVAVYLVRDSESR